MTLQEWIGPPTPKRVIAVSGAIAGVVAAIMAITNFLGVAEPYWLATRGFMREHVDQVVKKQDTTLRQAQNRSIGIEIRIEEGERRRIRGRISDLELELQKNPTAADSLRRLIQEQIVEQKQELDYKETIINDLRRLQRNQP